jgi:hypothetical protein
MREDNCAKEGVIGAHMPTTSSKLRVRSGATRLLLVVTFTCLAGSSVRCADLKGETSAAFERYVAASEKRMQAVLERGTFLFIDEWPANRRGDGYTQLRNGQLLVQQVNTEGEGHPIEIPHGLIHDWVGVLFIPNATLSQTLAVIQNYDNHQNIYNPEVRQSKLLSHNNEQFKVFLQLYQKSLVTVVMNAEFDINYERLAPNRAVSRSYSTKIAEVENFGQKDEHELPVDDGHGYLWRLYSYWHFEEKDGGVYLQLESIGLSRSVPAIIAWLVNPLLRSIPRRTLSSLLNATRRAVPKTAPIARRLWSPPDELGMPSVEGAQDDIKKRIDHTVTRRVTIHKLASRFPVLQ